MNILSGFKKSRISPLNPSKVSDRMETHPGSSDADSMTTHVSQSVSTVSSGDLSDILKYPESNATTKKKKSAFNSTAVCLSVCV